MTSPQTKAMVETTILGLAATRILPVIGETIEETIPLLVARLTCHNEVIDHVCDQLEEMPLEHVEAIEDDTKIVQARLTSTKHQITELLDERDANRLEMAKLHSQAQDAEARLCLIKRLFGLL
ncbi:hypothetical protein Tco_0884376 [Tanacetum coccineum]